MTYLFVRFEKFSRRPGEVIHEKAWINYINTEIAKAKQRLQVNGVVLSHSFRVLFVTRHLKHAESHRLSAVIGHKKIANTLKYNRYALDKKETREILDKRYI